MGYVQRHSGLVVPESFAEPSERPAQPEMREVATTTGGRDITRGYVDPMMLLRPQDSVLRLRGNGNYELYREVLRDDQVQACFSQRRLAVISREWEVVPGGDASVDEEAAEFLREQLRRIDFDSVTDKMLYGVYYGYAVAECLWAREGSRVVLAEIRVRDRRRFGWDSSGRLRLRTMSNPDPGELLPERKFWTFATGADHDDEPYGLGLAHWLYWPVFFKRGGMRLWLTFLDKFGAPTVRGTYPPNATAEEKQRLLAALEAVTSESGVIIPEGMAIELLEAARSGSADYKELYDRMDRAIAKVVLGQVATTEGTPGRLGNDDAQQAVRLDLVKADADLICASFNRSVVRWLTAYNFPAAAPPEVWRKVEEAEDLGRIAERDATLASIGYRPTLARIRDVYGDGYEPVEGAPAPTPGPSFAEPDDARRWHGQDQEQIDAEADRLAADWERLLGRRVRELLELAEETEDLETFRARLADLAGAEPDPQLVQALERAGFVAGLWGRWRAETDARRLSDEGDAA